MTAKSPARLVRPVKCHLCKQPMFYVGDARHEPEVSVNVINTSVSGKYLETKNHGFYAHARCWNKRMKSK